MKSSHPTGRLLVIDDDAGVTETFARMLTIEGHDVRTANSAEQGLREAASSRFDAIVLDLRMPLIDGLGFLYRLRASEPYRSTPVVIVTGDYFLDDNLTAELRRCGAEIRYKPLWIEDLAEVVRTLLTASGRRQAPSAWSALATRM